MAPRSYGQFCTLARTLDVVGQRWTLLVLRDLMLGAKRFTDLLDGLPGIGRNLLTERLRQLESAGLITRDHLPAPAASRVYQLTDDGRALGPAMAALGRWGAERLDKPEPDLAFRPAWMVFPLAYMADPEAAGGVHEVYELRVDGETFHLRVSDGAIEPRAGAGSDPVLVMRLATATLRELFTWELAPADAISQGRIEVEGEPPALRRFMAIFAAGPAPHDQTQVPAATSSRA